MANTEQLKAENIRTVRSLFYGQAEPWTRPDLAEASGLSMGGTTNILHILMDREEVIYLGDAPSTGGRKSKLYGLNPDFAHIGTILLSHANDLFSIVTASIDLTGRVISRRQLDIPNPTGFELLSEAAQDLCHSDPLVRCLVISFPGIVSPEGAATSSDFPGLTGINIRERLEEILSFPVMIENDVNLAAIAYARKHPECENLAVLYQPNHDPAGVGIMIQGRLYRGRGGLAGEIGRIETDAQLSLLQSDPGRLLQIQLAALNCLLAPERIAWYCPMLDHTDFTGFPSVPEMAGPLLEHIDDLEKLTRYGAELCGRKLLLRL